MARPKLEDAESKLLAAGLSLFAKEGTERINTNRIARRAGVGIGTFYSHFSDKYALLREIETRTLVGLQAARIAAIREVGAGEAGSDLAKQARPSVEAAVHFAQQHPEAYRVTFGRERAGASRHGPVVSESSRPLAEALRRLQSVGRLARDLDVDLSARAYLSMEVGTLLWWLEDSSRAEATDLADTLARMHPAAHALMREPRMPNSSITTPSNQTGAGRR